MNFAEVAGRIDGNVLGRLMYGQRELFHSNLLAWFFDALPDSADEVFRPFSAAGVGSARSAERERQNMDLVLRWPDRAPLVIENKVFSLPDLAQLDEYARLAGSWRGSPPAFCLLAMSAPDLRVAEDGTEATENGWRYLGYAELARRIEKALPADQSYEVETMRRYAALVEDLQHLVSSTDVVSEQERVWLSDAELSAVSSSQTRAALQKARAQRIARLISREVPGRHRDVEHGMTRSVALVSCFEHIRIRGVDAWAGWQLQGAQFRRAVIFDDPAVRGRGAAFSERRAALARSLPELFVMPTVLELERAGRNEFNHYAPDFVYQYGRVPSLSVRRLLDAAAEIHADLARFESVDDGDLVGRHSSSARED
ncbi:hypothetical protein SAMN06295885_3537 [Rathayibacter oskolensis]|uniref:PD-(D/E)XK nuclease superfamily protein n=1 Tax=Rathayibacter oskolensis TaxID=1891671 RepID=A0A1X7PHH2_9MICO|nr:hypothetical protein [Rathayibacter oskolensis]SMH50433.1 hypothetical protein SAMN06295885_3537 [Rathayibacter oskolensis]